MLARYAVSTNVETRGKTARSYSAANAPNMGPSGATLTSFWVTSSARTTVGARSKARSRRRIRRLVKQDLCHGLRTQLQRLAEPEEASAVAGKGVRGAP